MYFIECCLVSAFQYFSVTAQYYCWDILIDLGSPTANVQNVSQLVKHKLSKGESSHLEAPAQTQRMMQVEIPCVKKSFQLPSVG